MNNLLIKIIFFIFTFFLYCNLWNADISFTVSPIKYEIEANTWTIITKTAMLFNRTNSIITIYTWKSDFEAKDKSWNPIFIRKNTNDTTWQELSNWINIEQESIDIWANEEKEITFTINIPNNATPGWHYWAIFFKNNNSKNNTQWQIKINVDYWILLLVNVAWEIIKEAEVEDTIIVIKGSSWNWWYYNLVIDDCPYWDFTSSFYDKKCIDNWNDILSIIKNNDIKKQNNTVDTNKKDDDFNIDFSIPFINTWNTHIKPTGKIKLIDEDWNEIKWIWKKSILNEDWAIIWEKIVDYLPVNDIWWNVLPDTSRNFELQWKWFPYKDYDENWNQIIKYFTPDEYYTNKNLEKLLFLMPWERLNEKICDKNITAVTELSYLDENWEEIKFNSAKDFSVKYKEIYIWLNPYTIALIIIIFLIIFILWLIFRKKKIKCIKCSKKINKDMKICPYCWKKQKN